MLKAKEKLLHREIIKIKKPYPKDDLIITYKDFLKNRSSLPYYQFNSELFKNIISLIIVKWKSHERISRLSLLETLKRYCLKDSRVENYFDFNTTIVHLNINLRKKLFHLYKLVWEFPEFITEKQQEEAQKIVNLLMINVALEKEEEIWLCMNFKKSPLILNRILRYPEKSNVISAWARQNYDEDALRSRRAEIISFILDENPNFEVGKKTIMDDFEFQNFIDRKAIAAFKEGMLLFNLFQDSNDIIPIGEEIDRTLPYPELKLTKRFYQVPTQFSDKFYEELPDFKKLEMEFASNLNLSFQVTMMWAIGYSRISNDLKVRLIPKYYSKESEATFIRVCKRNKLYETLEWLLRKVQLDSR